MNIPVDHKFILNIVLSTLNERLSGFELFQFKLQSDGNYFVSVRRERIAYGFVMSRFVPHFISAIEAIDMTLASNRWHNYGANGDLILPEDIEQKRTRENNDVKHIAEVLALTIWRGYCEVSQNQKHIQS